MYNQIEKILSLSNSVLYIYGAGELGLIMEKILLKNDIIIKGFLVSEGYKKQQENNKILEYNLINGTINNNNDIKNSIVIITTSNNSQNIKDSLYRHSAIIYDFSSIDGFLEIYSYYYNKFLNEKSINGLENPEIHFSSFKVLNPYQQDNTYALSFYLEFADLLMPALAFEDPFYNEGPYEWDNVQLKKDDIVIDCGSNIGLFSVYAASKNCFVYSFEPDPLNINYLDFMKQQFPNNIEIVPYALSNFSGSTNFELHTDIGACSKIALTPPPLTLAINLQIYHII